MPVAVARILAILVLAYLGTGVLFAVPFVVRGVDRIDPAAREGTPGFRLLLLPGAAALWPWLLVRWLAGAGRPPEERNDHRDAVRRTAGGGR